MIRQLALDPCSVIEQALALERAFDGPPNLGSPARPRVRSLGVLCVSIRKRLLFTGGVVESAFFRRFRELFVRASTVVDVGCDGRSLVPSNLLEFGRDGLNRDASSAFLRPLAYKRHRGLRRRGTGILSYSSNLRALFLY
jgi:hypothetical protein